MTERIIREWSNAERNHTARILRLRELLHRNRDEAERELQHRQDDLAVALSKWIQELDDEADHAGMHELISMRKRHEQQRLEASRTLRALEEREAEERLRQEEEARDAERKAQQRKREEEDEQARKREEKKTQAPVPVDHYSVGDPSTKSNVATSPKFDETLRSSLVVSASALREARRVEQALEQVTQLSQSFSQDSQYQQLRLQLKKTIKRSTIQISGTQKQVLLKVNDFVNVLHTANNLAGDPGTCFAMVTIADSLVLESEGQIARHPESAFPVAAVICALVASYPKMQDIFLGVFYKMCPYVLPRYVPRLVDMSDEQFRNAQGYREGESQERYFERIAGYISLFAAITQTEIPISAGVGKNPLDISLGWSWLSRICNLKPRRITTTCIDAFLSIAGYEMGRHFGRQFRKLLLVIVEDLIPRMPEGSPKGAAARIKVFASDCFRLGQHMPPPNGKNLPKTNLSDSL